MKHYTLLLSIHKSPTPPNQSFLVGQFLPSSRPAGKQQQKQPATMAVFIAVLKIQQKQFRDSDLRQWPARANTIVPTETKAIFNLQISPS